MTTALLADSSRLEKSYSVGLSSCNLKKALLSNKQLELFFSVSFSDPIDIFGSVLKISCASDYDNNHIKHLKKT